MADSETNVGDTKKKKYYPRKKDTRDRSEEMMTKYYKEPENQKNLRERITKYKECIADLQTKITQLEKYMFDILPEDSLRKDS
jgi:uncharacterized coiled-coil DUF342 family protein